MANAPLDFAGMIEKERERLARLAEDYRGQIAEIEGQLAAVHAEMRAITAYDEAKKGKPPAAPRKATTLGGTRVRKGSKRDELLMIIRENPGISRKEILAKLTIVEKDNKQGAQQVSSALTNMKKANAIVLSDGRYSVAPT
jgi:hypothetical protein